MLQVDFFELARSVQDRLLSSCRGEFEPKPILFRYATLRRGIYWLLLTPLSLVGMWLLYVTGLGEMTSGLGRHGMAFMALFVLLAILFALGIVQWATQRAATASLPFIPGYYLFPACLVDARSVKLVSWPISELKTAAIEGDHVVVSIADQVHRFPVPAMYADQALSAIKLAQMQCGDDLEDAARVLLDPFTKPVVPDPFAPEKALVARKPLWVKIRLVAAVAFGVVGVVVFQKRDRVSDDAMFKVAQANDDIATYQLYLSKGTAHQDTVRSLLLPRAELRIAIADGSVAAIDAFKAKYPNTGIGEEIKIARRNAVETAFIAAKKPGTFDALMKFEADYPTHHVARHMAAAMHAIYAKALEGYKAKMPKDGAMLDAAAQLIAFAEKTGPIATDEGARGAFVEVVMRPVPSKALGKANALVERNPYFAGPKSLPSRYLSTEKLQPLEGRLAKRYATMLEGGFPNTVLRFRPGADVDGAKPLPTVKVPTLVVSYRMEPSGVNYASAKPRGIYIGLGFFFRIDLLIPGAPTQTMKHMLQLRVPHKLVVAHAKKPEGSLEEKIYADMTERAFDDMFEKYAASWLPPAPGAN